MLVRGLGLIDFRSYAELELELPAGVSVFLGRNGQGKTNLVEAVAFLATHDSHRVATTAPLVRSGARRALLRATVERHGRALSLELEVTPGRATRARINRVPVPRARDAVGLLRVVAFAPEDLSVVKGDPGERRGYLDELLSVRAPRYVAIRADYERVLRQRTMLLRSAAAARRGGDLSTLDVWDSHLARAGAALLARRLQLVEQLRRLHDNAYTEVAGTGGPVGVTYRSSVGANIAGRDSAELVEAMLGELRSRRGEEIDRGACLVGPHRDELVLALGELPARGYASHGECWSLALALRLAAYDLLRGDGVEPVLVLDDVFAELDIDRRRRLGELVETAEQALVTAAVAADVPPFAGARFEVRGGEVRHAG